MSNDQSRFAAVSRRAFLERSALLGVAGVFGLAACGGNSDAKVFSGATTTAAGPKATGTTSTASAGTTAKAATTGTTSPAAAASGTPLPGGAALQVAFTFALAQAGGFPAKNPYIAVWIEDADGKMVRTVSLWLQSGRGERYWRDLPRWYGLDTARAAAGGPATADTITGATRTPGDYTVSWDGKTFAGAAAPQGPYYVCIEAAREHGPYELIRETVTLGGSAFDKALTPKGELTKASVSYVV